MNCVANHTKTPDQTGFDSQLTPTAATNSPSGSQPVTTIQGTSDSALPSLYATCEMSGFLLQFEWDPGGPAAVAAR